MATYHQAIDWALSGKKPPMAFEILDESRLCRTLATIIRVYDEDCMALVENNDDIIGDYCFEMGYYTKIKIGTQHELRVAKARLKWLSANAETLNKRRKTELSKLQRAIKNAHVDMSSDMFSSWLREMKTEGYL